MVSFVRNPCLKLYEFFFFVSDKKVCEAIILPLCSPNETNLNFFKFCSNMLYLENETSVRCLFTSCVSEKKKCLLFIFFCFVAKYRISSVVTLYLKITLRRLRNSLRLFRREKSLVMNLSSTNNRELARIRICRMAILLSIENTLKPPSADIRNCG